LLTAVEEAATARKVGPPGTVESLRTLVAHADRPSARVAMRLAGRWKLAELRNDVEAVAMVTPDPDPLDTAAAVDALALFGDAKARELLLKLSLPTVFPASTVHRAFVAYCRLDPAAGAKLAPEYLFPLTDPAAASEVFRAFLTKKGSPQLLAAALKGKTLSADVAKVGIRVTKASALNSPELIAALTKAGNLAAAKPYPTDAEVKQLAAEVATHGDPARGELVFRKKDNQCLNCHAIGGAGGKVGPDLTSVGASAQVDYLVESILNPNKAVKEGYNAVKVTTKAGAVIQGVPVKEANGELTLRDSEDKEVKVRLDQIDEKVPTRSLMADGLADPLTRQELIDLVRFLSELGKVGPYGPSTARVVRRWQAVDGGNGNTNKMRQARITAVADPAVEFLWLPAYSLTSGDLPLSELPKFTVWNNTAAQSVVRCQFDVTTPGKVRLKLTDATGLTGFVGPNPVELKTVTDLDLAAGVQTLTLIVDRSERTKDLRIELDDVPGSPAQTAVVGGK
jgi:putative heme-binding domain-containing protein